MATTDVEAFTAAAWRDGRGSWSDVPALTIDRLRRALTAATGVDLDDDQARAAFIAVGELVGSFAPPPSLAAADKDAALHLCITVRSIELAEPAPEALHIDPALVDLLPLVDLARDAARSEPLSVVLADLGPHLHGVCAGAASAWGGVILIAASLLHDRRRLKSVWAHELAHHLDRDLARVARAGREAFADRLGELLLEHQPATVDEAAPLIERAEVLCGPLRRRLPLPGDLAGLIEHALAEAGAC